MPKLLTALVPVAALALPSRAQSLNVDFEPATNPYGPISPAHGGVAESPGVWNSVSSPSVADLEGLNGAPTDADVTITSAVNFASQAFLSTGEDIDAVLNDYFTRHTAQYGLTFTQLSPGEYDVYTICSVLIDGPGLWVTVSGSPEGAKEVWGTWNGYVEGANFTRHHTTVTQGSITISMSHNSHDPFFECAIHAIQLVKVGDQLAGDLMCFGDGSSAGCPCSNTGDRGKGCQNSAGTGGAFLAATGTTSPDTVVLTSSGELPNALTIFLQGTANIQPTSFGDGLRCAGGPLLRLYVKSASGGVASAPGPGDPSIIARAAALGAPIDPTDRRYYHAYYRDPNTGFCAPPQGANFNSSQMVKLVW